MDVEEVGALMDEFDELDDQSRRTQDTTEDTPSADNHSGDNSAGDKAPMVDEDTVMEDAPTEGHAKAGHVEGEELNDVENMSITKSSSPFDAEASADKDLEEDPRVSDKMSVTESRLSSPPDDIDDNEGSSDHVQPKQPSSPDDSGDSEEENFQEELRFPDHMSGYKSPTPADAEDTEKEDSEKPRVSDEMRMSESPLSPAPDDVNETMEEGPEARQAKATPLEGSEFGGSEEMSICQSPSQRSLDAGMENGLPKEPQPHKLSIVAPKKLVSQAVIAPEHNLPLTPIQTICSVEPGLPEDSMRKKASVPATAIISSGMAPPKKEKRHSRWVPPCRHRLRQNPSPL
jgi:hypothetical protein